MVELLATVILLYIGIYVWKHRGRDDSDAPGARSGLVIYTDALTKVQYVGVPFNGLTVRVDAEGKPILAR